MTDTHDDQGVRIGTLKEEPGTPEYRAEFRRLVEADLRAQGYTAEEIKAELRSVPVPPQGRLGTHGGTVARIHPRHPS